MRLGGTVAVPTGGGRTENVLTATQFDSLSGVARLRIRAKHIRDFTSPGDNATVNHEWQGDEQATFISGATQYADVPLRQSTSLLMVVGDGTGANGAAIAPAVGLDDCDVIWDGVVNPGKLDLSFGPFGSTPAAGGDGAVVWDIELL